MHGHAQAHAQVNVTAKSIRWRILEVECLGVTGFEHCVTAKSIRWRILEEMSEERIEGDLAQ